MTTVDEAQGQLEDSPKFFRDRGFGQIIGFGTSPALVVVDLIRGFTNPDLPLGAPLGDVLTETRKLLVRSRAADVPVFFTSVAYDDGDLADAGVWASKMQGLMTLRAGTPEVEVDPMLGRLDSEPIILKKYASAFYGTDFLSRLVYRQIDTLLLTGCTTSGCIRATAVDGVQHGYRVMVAREAVGDRSSSAHEQSLFDLHAKYADVVTVKQIESYLSELPPLAEPPPDAPWQRQGTEFAERP